MTDAPDVPLFITRKQLGVIVAGYGLTADGFRTLPGAPQPIQISQRRPRWRRDSVTLFLAQLEVAQ